MARKNIFQLVEENYDIKSEVAKIYDLYKNGGYFTSQYRSYTLSDLVEVYLLEEWKYRDTCIDVDEYLERVDADVSDEDDITEERIINFLEVVENFIKLYFDNAEELYNQDEIEYYADFTDTFENLIKTLEKRMGLTTREYKDRIIIYPKNAPLEKVVDICDDEDVQWELIRYVREELSLSEKRKSLAYLATNLYIEEDKNEKDEKIKKLVNKANNILNNLHIRHNNKTGKWENKALEGISEKDAISLCDMVYNEMLTIVLMREHKQYDEVYSRFNKTQKENTSSKKKFEDQTD